MIITALAVDTAACILFLLAHGVGALFAARALQGVAVGLAANALGAALLDLRPAGSLAPLPPGPCHRATVLFDELAVLEYRAGTDQRDERRGSHRAADLGGGALRSGQLPLPDCVGQVGHPLRRLRADRLQGHAARVHALEQADSGAEQHG